MEQTLREAGRFICESKSIVVTTHIMPDGDGLGAEIALYYYLLRLGKKVRILNPDILPQRYYFLDRNKVIETINQNTKNQHFDLGIVVDTHDPKRLSNVWEFFKKNSKNILFFDHHPQVYPDHLKDLLDDIKTYVAVDEKSSSIGELLYRLFYQAHDLLDSQTTAFRLSPEIALGLYVSIITDTNSFRYARTTALSHRIAADLIDFGLQPEEIYQNIYSTKSVANLRLIGEVLSKVQTESGSPNALEIAWVEIPKKLRKKFGATSDDTEGIVNFLLLLREIDILILFREEDDGKIKVSLKSKGKIKVNSIAQEFGGGGHDFAAGFVVRGSLDQTKKKLIARLKLEDKK